MATKKFKISYNTGGKTKTQTVNSAKERDGVLRFMKARKEKDGYRDIKVTEIKPKKK